MEYNIEFKGQIEIEPPLSPEEVSYISTFAATRHNELNESGPYVISENPRDIEFLNEAPDMTNGKRKMGSFFGVDIQIKAEEDLDCDEYFDMEEPPPIEHGTNGKPGIWCHWVPSVDGTKLGWDGVEKAYGQAEWLQYIIDHFFCCCRTST